MWFKNKYETFGANEKRQIKAKSEIEHKFSQSQYFTMNLITSRSPFANMQQIKKTSNLKSKCLQHLHFFISDSLDKALAWEMTNRQYNACGKLTCYFQV